MTMSIRTMEELAEFLAEHHLVGSWARDKVVPPRTGKTAAHWRGEGIRNALLGSGEMTQIGSGGQTGMRSVTGIEARRAPVYMNAQVLMPGERTEAHRNLRSETRLVLEASPGAVFVCEFEAYPMNRGDVVISPPWTYHDHFNGSTKPVMFIDGYDNGYNPNVNVNEKLPYGQLYEDISRPPNYSRYLHSHSRPISDERPFPLPPMHYPWSDTEAALEAMREAGSADPYEGTLLMLSSPVDNGPTLPTMAWQVQLLEHGAKTLSHRHNSTSYYHVFEGEGCTIIDGEQLEWHKGDIFGVPPWTWHHHESTHSDDTILFSVDDWPAMKKLGFFMKDGEIP